MPHQFLFFKYSLWNKKVRIVFLPHPLQSKNFVSSTFSVSFHIALLTSLKFSPSICQYFYLFPQSPISHLSGKESICNAGNLGSIPRLGISHGEENGYPLQYSGLENFMDCIIHGVAKSWTWLRDFHFHIFSLFTTCKFFIHPWNNLETEKQTGTYFNTVIISPIILNKNCLTYLCQLNFPSLTRQYMG